MPRIELERYFSPLKWWLQLELIGKDMVMNFSIRCHY